MTLRSKFPYLLGFILALLAVAMLFPFGGGAAPGPQPTTPAPTKVAELPNFDAFGASTRRAAAAGQADAQGQKPFEGGHMVQSEPRLGVPTFLWAAQSPDQSFAQSGNQGDAAAAAKDYLTRYASRYRLSPDDIVNARVASVHDTGQGAIVVKLKQDIDGVEVFRDEINVIMNHQRELIALSGYLTGRNDGLGAASQQFSFGPGEALAKALQDLTGSSINASVLHNVQAASAEPNPYLLMTADRGATPGFTFVDDPARIKKVYYHLVDEYVPAYYIEADVYLPSSGGDVLSAETGGWMPEERAYSYVISATDGQVLFRNNLIAEQKVKSGGSESNLGPGGFTYRVWADPATGIPYDTPAGNGPHPKAVTTPDGAQFPFVSPNNVQLPNFPFSQNDPWLAPGSTTTSGNNVEAFVNLVNAGGNVDNGFGPAAEPPADPPTGDHHAFTSAVDQFIYNTTPDVDAYSVNARQASITQLFYDINFLHDFYYDSGFNEAAGNAQTNNFGRGGLGSDNIKGQAMDTSSFNNANMLTPADGGRPRMRMYNFINPANMLDIQAPAAIQGKVNIGISQTGTHNFDNTADIVIATFSNSPSACTITNAAALAGKIGMFDFDNTDGTGCSFSTRITKIHATSALAALMVYTSASPTSVANITGLLTSHTKGIGVISWNNGQAIKGVIGANTVTARLLRVADRDGALDAQVVFHEWGHYISNRLIGNSSGLVGFGNPAQSQGLGMGEGWGDFDAMLALTVRPDDTSVASNANWNGAYALATYATSGVPFNGTQNQGYYYGIRRYPYSTDMANINPLTFKHITNGQALPAGPPVAFGQTGSNNAEVHNTGEVWASMLWECYAALLRDTQGATPRLTFQQAQDRMKNYLVASFKMTPVTPTFTEARDAVLAAAYAYDYNDGRLFAQAFAKRGIGVGAVAPDRFSTTNSGVTESFDAGNSLTYVSATLDDSTSSCDFDGYLDNGEKGLLNVSIKNNGTQNLFATTATVSSSNAHVTFPSGATITFPNAQPGQTVTGSVAVTASGMSGIENSDFTITIQDAGPPTTGPVTAHFYDNLNVDEVPASSATDAFDEKGNLWTTSTLFNLGAPNMPASSTNWTLLPATGLAPNHQWYGLDSYFGSDAVLTSPVMTVNGGGSVSVAFDHSFGFEFDGGGNYDGAVVEYSVNGGAFADMGTTGGLPNYNGTILNYSGDVNPLKGRSGFVQTSGTIHTSFTKAIAPGSTVQVRFRAASDSSVGSTGWTVDNVAFSGVVETPFATLTAETAICNPPPPTPPVTIVMSPSTTPAGTVGTPYSLTITPSGGTGPYTYSTVPVILPPGFSSSVDGSNNFVISGTPTAVGTYIVTVKANDSASHQGSQNYTIVINKGNPVITWSNPADITYGTALSGTQLNASASVPGAFTYTPAATTVLNAGNAQNLHVDFVPTDTTNYNNASKNVSINVLKATPSITWSNPADITYPAALSGTQLNATANTPGTFTYTPPATTVLNAGNGQTLSVNFVPTDTANYNNASKNVSINVLKGAPVITWSNPADITYPTALSATQLNATANVPGVFTYTPPALTVLNGGNGQILSVNFVPTDTANYSNASKNVSINVLKANQTISFGALSDKPIGSAPFTVSGSASSGLPLTFGIQTGPATINSGTVTLTGLGTVTVRASQAGDGNYNAATPVDRSFNVTKAPASTLVGSNLNPSMLGQPVTFTATVTSGVTPTGTVTFKNGATTIGTGTLNASGVATFTTSSLALGLHGISADYPGDTNCLASSGTLSGGQQVNSPPNGVIQFTSSSYSVNEAAGSIAVSVSRTGDVSLPASIDYATNDGGSPSIFVPCSLISGAARDRCDFTRTLGTIQFAAGQSTRTFTVLISDDSYIEGIETLQLVLSNPSAGALLGSQSTATLSIIDDDVVASGNPINNASAFVEQLYRDFLNRQPDSAGLAFWTAQITSCGSNQTCIDSARVNVAAAFFLSIEFNETGYLVERLYKTAYGSGTGSSTFGGVHSLPVPIIRFDEFLLDRQKVADGVIVGQPGWDTVLENNKVAYINEFVLRSRFTTAYPAGMTAATFVDMLNTNAGNPLTTAQRNQLVSDLSGGIKTRAQVLRSIAENPTTVSAEFNRAFVLMQYFGFLRRNPNDAPDTDYTGFDFWLTKLNQFNGNYINAEMVKAFITSTEFRQRFGN